MRLHSAAPRERSGVPWGMNGIDSDSLDPDPSHCWVAAAVLVREEPYEEKEDDEDEEEDGGEEDGDDDKEDDDGYSE